MFSLPFETQTYYYARFLFYRGLFLTYLLAFLVAYNQFIPLCGRNGLQPFPSFLKNFGGFFKRPTIFWFFQSDRAVKIVSLIGIVLSGIGLLGIEMVRSLPVAIVLVVLWASYLSIVKAGGIFYGYGWESFLLETGILSVFLGGSHVKSSPVLLFLFSWLLFRVMLGAGLIKIRGDQCWRDLTCMDYHYETQPMPNPMSWFAHHLPEWFHKIEVLGNHIVELIVPFFYFFPQPYAGIAGLMTIGFQGWLMVTGNFSWLNFLTIVVSVLLVPDSFFQLIFGLPSVGNLSALPFFHQYALYTFAMVVIVLSYWPAKNLLSRKQLMNAGFDPFNLVNTYGAFGSITKKRYELVVEGRREGEDWKTYEFKGKPTDCYRRPPQWAPYHLRLDWQMWFAAMRSRPRLWLMSMVEKLLQNDSTFCGLLQENPFEGEDPPDEVRIVRYHYEYTDPGEGSDNGRWWEREFVGEMLPPIDRQGIRRYLG